MLKCEGSRGDVKKRGKGCWGVGEKWGSVESGESTGRNVGGEGKCRGVNVKSVAKCVRVWGEAWGVGGRCKEVFWGVRMFISKYFPILE